MNQRSSRAINRSLAAAIKTCAACGRLIKQAQALSRKDGNAGAWFETWLQCSKEYREKRLLFLLIYAEDIARVARQVGIKCDADQVTREPFDIAIKIDKVLRRLSIYYLA
jgi:hypothetical protein